MEIYIKIKLSFSDKIKLLIFNLLPENLMNKELLRPEQITENIKIIETPGHNYTSLTMLVKTDSGTIAICGDVFWKENYPEKDPYADDIGKLRQSRKKVLEVADFIIPGHAGMFEVRK